MRSSGPYSQAGRTSRSKEDAMRKPTRIAVDDYRHPFRTGKQRRAAA
jgi:hypothetical protein